MHVFDGILKTTGSGLYMSNWYYQHYNVLKCFLVTTQKWVFKLKLIATYVTLVPQLGMHAYLHSGYPQVGTMATYSLNWCLQVKSQVGYNYVAGWVQSSYQIKITTSYTAKTSVYCYDSTITM